MTNYRRANIAGATYFFTVNVADRREALLTRHIGLLRAAFQYVQERYPCTTEAIVILTDHLHIIWTLPPGDADFSTRWRLLEAGFSRKLSGEEKRSASRISKRERGIWQRRYWAHLIRDEEDLARHVDYIHINPVKHGYVKRVADWPHSSFHRFVAAGMLPPDWAGSADVEIDCGEPGSW
ncbi:MAG TPA: transposase [Gallionellaceae bacterium]|nr:transposase [Gallionellaceae bacterium]